MKVLKVFMTPRLSPWQIEECQIILSKLREKEIYASIADIAFLWEERSNDVSAGWLSGLIRISADDFLDQVSERSSVVEE